MKRIGKITALLITVALLGLHRENLVLAGKGGGGPGGGAGGGPTPPGSIYFQIETDSTSTDRTCEMDADGGHIQLALPGGMFGYPSTLRYGANGHRTWLIALEDPDRKYDFVYHADGSVQTDVPHEELFAVQVTPLGNDSFDIHAVRVCNSFGVFKFAAPPPTYVGGQFNGTIVDGMFTAQWSAEGLDAYAFGRGTDIRNAFSVNENGVTSLDLRLVNSSSLTIVHLPTNTMTLGQAVEAGVAEAAAIVEVVPGTFNSGEYQVSPDTSLVLGNYYQLDPNSQFYIGGLELRDTLTGQVLWNDLVDNGIPRWSPTGNQVVYDDGTGIWLRNLTYSGSSPSLETPYVLYPGPGGRFAFEACPRWSPAADHIIFQQRQYKKGSYRYDILRIPTSGTDLTPVNLTGSLANRRLYPLRWCADDVAP